MRQEGQYKRNGPDLRGANLNKVNLSRLPLARILGGLSWDDWIPATQEQREMAGIHLNEADLSRAHLERCDLSGAFFNVITNLKDIHMSSEKLGVISLVDISWGVANLSVVNWSSLKILGNERKAKKSNRLEDYQTAVRANRQLAVALQEQGLNEDAARFAYRAQRLQRVVLRRQRKFGTHLFSLFLDLLAGYGYRPGRSVFWYLVIIVGFATAYYTFGHISPLEAFILSLTSFHGRGFFPHYGYSRKQ